MAKVSTILCVSSSGGHWTQLLELREAWQATAEGAPRVIYACSGPGERPVDIGAVETVPDINRNTIGSVGRSIRATHALFRKHRPDVVVSTGALPGLIAILMGRLKGARTIWIESIANAERMSLSGSVAARLANECFVQWPHLAKGRRPRYAGAVL